MERDNELGRRDGDAALAPELIQEQVRRILASSLFVQSGRLSRFLSLTVETTLEGKGEQLKEYLIGTEVYGRPSSYEPSQDSIVRTEARRLRTKLKAYYETIGARDPIYIYFRPGSYIPVFHSSRPELASLPLLAPAEPLLAEGRGVAVAVLPFTDLSGTPLSASGARGITDELTHALTLTDGVSVASTTAVAQALATPWDIASLIARLNVALIIEGTVREESGKLRIGIRVVYADGFPSTSHRFETLADARLLSQVQERIASAFVSRARPEQSAIRRRTATPSALMLTVYPLVIRAEALLDEGAAEDLQEALLKFQEAMSAAPGYARPYCGAAMCHAELALRGAASSREAITRAEIAAQQAVTLDPDMFGAYATLACAQALAWKWSLAESSFQRAARLGMHAATSRELSLFLLAMGRVEEGLHHLEVAQRIDPFSNRQKAGRWKAFHLTRKFREAETAYLEPRAWGPLPLEAHLYMALCYVHINKPHLALEIVEQVRPDTHVRLSLLAAFTEISALCGMRIEAERTVKEFDLLGEDSTLSHSRRALLAMALGQHEQALASLDAALGAHEADLVWIRMEPRFDALRDRADFQRIQDAVFADPYTKNR